MSIFDLLPEWDTVEAGIKKIAKVLEEVHQKGLAVGVLQKTDNSNVFIEEVLMSGALPNHKVQEGEIAKSHGQITGAWGTTRVNAILQFAMPQGKDATFSIILMKVKINAKITLKPESEFKQIEDFAPLYRKLMTDHNGNKEEFAAAVATRTISEYNAFGTVNGVLFHELLHYTLAKKFAQTLVRKTVGGSSGQFDSREAATEAFRNVVNDVWKEWRGLILHDERFFDERFVWHQECLHYIKEFESAGKPGYTP